ncbi:MAG TPA: WD40 repeat domain-containing protein, partial [Anaerolineales bacterium]|nr:WD40 repeat domain-containing protein [Anaerolineales bacterium]
QIVGLAWSLDGDSLITLSQYESLAVWDVKTGQPSRSINEHASWVLDLDWSPNGSMLASGAENGEIILWESVSGKKLRSFHDPAGWVRNVTWSPDGKEIASGGQNEIKIWDVQTGEQVRTLPVNTQVSGLAWSPDGNMLASISYEGTTTLWDSSTGEQLRSLPANYSSMNLAWSPQGDRLSTTYPNFEGEQVTLWDPHTGEPVLTNKGMHDLAWSPLGDIVASISDNGTGEGRDDTTVVLWDPQTGEEIRSFNTGTFLTNIGWSPDGKLLVVSGAHEANHALIVLDAQTGEQLHYLKGHYNVPTAVAWSPRGDFIASSSHDGTVIIWRIVP